MTDFPNVLRYTKDHEWVERSGKIAKVGISDYAQSQMGDIVFIELPEIGRVLTPGDVVCVVESVKAVSEVYAPVSGVVIKVNSALEDQPELVNEDPYGYGWMVEVEMESEQATDNLLDSEAYARLVEEEGGH